MAAEKLHEMTFEKFAQEFKPTGAVNKIPAIGNGKEIITYSVFMNGDDAGSLPPEVREFNFRDVLTHALTEKLGLNPESFRDNLKVAELVATRSAWIAAVLEASVQITPEGRQVVLSQVVMDDYALVTDGFNHPWLKDQVQAQRALDKNLAPALAAASQSLGRPVLEKILDEVNNGVVVSQNLDFTVQEIGNGEVVSHENRRLGKLPEVGQNITVAYYRGNGQVFDNSKVTELSVPYVDKKTGDLAVDLLDENKQVYQKVLFNSITSVAKFAEEQGLEKAFVVQAMDARAATPKSEIAKEQVERTIASDVYIDGKSGCLAVDYKENGIMHSAIFGSADALAKSRVLDFSAELIVSAKGLEEKQNRARALMLDAEYSKAEIERVAVNGFKDFNYANTDKGRYSGIVAAETRFHVAQDVGRESAVIHDKRDIDKVPKIGQNLAVAYDNGRGTVVDRTPAKEQAR